MWSAGICLYVMLVGTVPFRGATMQELHSKILLGKYEVDSDFVSEGAQDLMSKLLCVNYKKRLTAKETLNHPWLQWTQDGKEEINVDRSDLAEVIFTENERQIIERDYLQRLKKLIRSKNRRENKSLS
jgi:serine/threonine protein kinase